MMEHSIKAILEEHGIKDDKLANALADIYQLFREELESDLVNDNDLQNYMKGNR